MRTYRTALIGFGRIAEAYASDPRLARHFKYATHAQVLRDHPAFDWHHVVDPDPGARKRAREAWDIAQVHESVHELPDDIEVAVISTPADVRRSVLENLPRVEAVVLEKPLAPDAEEAERIIDLCERRNITTQVNLWRRTDTKMQRLASGGLEEAIGGLQFAFGVYGGGIKNNGTHLIDLVQMLLGPVESVRAIGPAIDAPVSQMPGDADVPVVLETGGGFATVLQTLDLKAYRDLGLDLWGTGGRLSILNGGLDILHHPRRQSRQLEDEQEIDHRHPTAWQPTVGEAIYNLYDDLASALEEGREPRSPGHSALRVARIVDAALASAAADGEPRRPRTA